MAAQRHSRTQSTNMTAPDLVAVLEAINAGAYDEEWATLSLVVVNRTLSGSVGRAPVTQPDRAATTSNVTSSTPPTSTPPTSTERNALQVGAVVYLPPECSPRYLATKRARVLELLGSRARLELLDETGKRITRGSVVTLDAARVVS